METQKSLLATIVLSTLFSSVAGAQVLNRVPGSHRLTRPPRSAARLLFNGAISDFNRAFESSREALFDLRIDNPVNIQLDICKAGEDGWDTSARTIRVCYSTVSALVSGGIQRTLLFQAGAYEEYRRRFASEPWNPGGMPSYTIAFLIAHELAHAIIDLWDVPVPGNIEIATDELAAVLLFENAYHGESGYADAVMHGAVLLTDIGELEDFRRTIRTRHGSSEQRALQLHCLGIGAQAAHVGSPKGDSAWRKYAAEVDSSMLDPTPARYRECIQGYNGVVRTWLDLLPPSIHWEGGANHLLRSPSR